ncbi:MAG: hypothetical protein ACP5NX_00040 [Candidatus Bilamarchaeaceae archaeon]
MAIERGDIELAEKAFEARYIDRSEVIRSDDNLYNMAKPWGLKDFAERVSGELNGAYNAPYHVGYKKDKTET